MSTLQLVQARRAERDALLRRLADQLGRDDQIAAAWLAGPSEAASEGLGDIDLWLAVVDEHLPAKVARRREYAAEVGQLLLVEESPEGGPSEGACLLVLYAGRAGPHQVHWRWLARSRARVPQGARLLVDRGGVLPAPPVALQTRSERAQMATARTALFWAMVHNAARCLARQEPWRALVMIGRAREALAEVRKLVGARAPQAAAGDDLPALSPCRQMGILRAMAGEMGMLAPQVARLGASVPVQLILQIERFLDLTEALMQETVDLECAGARRQE